MINFTKLKIQFIFQSTLSTLRLSKIKGPNTFYYAGQAASFIHSHTKFSKVF